MTAINPAKLKIQAAELVGSYQEPDRFVSGLHELLGFYSARIRQTSLARTPLALQTYQVPAPVIRALEIELSESVSSYPDQAITLADTLWHVDWVEFRQMGVILIGSLPGSRSKTILKMVKNWLKNCPTDDLRRQIMIRGLKKLSTEKPGQVLDLVRTLASSEIKTDQQAALIGLTSFVETSDFGNLPVIFKILREILLFEEPANQKEITALLRSLQKRSDQETASFLIRQLSTAAKPRIFRVIRQTLKYFNPESQAQLLESLSNFK